MNKIGVVYWSGTGNTEAMAEAIKKGAENKGAEVTLLTPDAFGPDQVDSYDVLAFGCPAMGDEVLEECEFDPMFESVEGSLSGKKVLLFGSYGWGDGQWMRDWVERCEGANLFEEEGIIVNESPEGEELERLIEAGEGLANW